MAEPITPLERYYRKRRQQLAGTVVPMGGIRSAYHMRSGTFDPSFWDQTFYYLGKPEEWLTRAIGNALSNDPKYDWENTSYRNRVYFADLASDALEGMGASVDPLVPALLGLTAAIVNPLDPINKLKIAQLTRRGLAAKHVDTLRRSAPRLFKKVEGVTQIADQDLIVQAQKADFRAARLRRLAEKARSKGSERAKGLRQAQKAAERVARDLDIGVRNRKALNEYLTAAQKSGMSFDELKLADTAFEQARLGQRRLLGFTSPFSMDHLRFFGRGKSLFDPASNSMLLGGFSSDIHPLGTKLDAAFIKGGMKTKEMLKKVTIEPFQSFTRKHLDQHWMTETTRALVPHIDQALKKIDLNVEQKIARIADRYRELAARGATRKEIEEIGSQVVEFMQQGGTAPVGEARAILKLALESLPDDVFNVAYGKIPVKTRIDKNRGIEYAADGTILGRYSDVPGANVKKERGGPVAILPHSTITAQEAIRIAGMAVNEPGARVPVGTRGRGVYFKGGFIIQDTPPHGIRSEGKLQHFRDTPLYGVAEYDPIRISDDAEDVIWAARRPYGMQRVLDPLGDSNAGLPLTGDHMANLELVAAQLADINVAMTRLSPSDLLINEYGGVYLINTENLAKAVGPAEAGEISHMILQDFALRHAIGTAPELEFPALFTKTSIKRAVRNLNKRARVRMNMGPTKFDKGAARVSSHLLLDQAINAHLHRGVALEDPQVIAQISDELGIGTEYFTIANNIQAKRAKIREAIAGNGDLASAIGPVRVYRNDFGELVITEGRDGLTAAVMEGVPIVDVFEAKIFSETLDPKAVFTRKLDPLSEVFYNDVKEIATLPLIEEFKQPILNYATRKNIFATNYKLLDEFANPRSITLDDLTYTVAPEQDLAAIVARAVATDIDGPKQSLFHVYLNALHKAFGKDTTPFQQSLTYNRNVDRLLLAEQLTPGGNLAVERAEDIPRLFEELTGIQDYRLVSLGTSRKEQIVQELQAALDNYYTELASRGVFTEKTIQVPKYRAAYQGATLEYMGESLVARSTIHSVEDTKKIAITHLESKAQLGEIVPFDKIEFHGIDGSETGHVRDLVPEPHPALSSDFRTPREIKISEEELAELNKRGIVTQRQATRETLKLDEYGRPIKRIYAGQPEKAAKFQRNVHSAVMTESGHVFYDIRQSSAHNPRKLIRDVFGEGPPSRLEVMLIDHQRVIFNYPIGTEIQNFGREAIKTIEHRIRLAAKQLQEAGYSSGLILEVTTPFDAKVWEEYFGKNTTLGDVWNTAKNRRGKWKLKIPEEKIGMPVDRVVDAPHYKARYIKPKFSDDPTGRAVKFIVEEQDELLRQEYLAMIPTRFRAEYIPRVPTAAGEKAIAEINKNFEHLFKSNRAIADLYKRFVHGRVLTDLTTKEYNDLIRAARKATKQGLDPERFIEKAIDKVIDTGEKQVLVKLAEAMDRANMPIESGFWHEDPLFAVASRIYESGEAQKASAVVRTMEKHGAVWSGTYDDLRAVRVERSKVSEKALQKLRTQRKTLELELEEAKANELVGNDEITALEEKIDKLIAEESDMIIKLDEKNRNAIQLGGPQALAVDLGAEHAYISNVDARRLMHLGKIKSTQVLGSLDNGLVAVPVSIVRDNLPEARLYMFPEEMVSLVERYFGSLNRSTGQARKVLDFVDKIQDAWRSWTLFPIPAYHGRNFVSNAVLAWIGDKGNISSYRQALRIMNIVRRQGKGSITMDQAIKMMQEAKITDMWGRQSTIYDLYAGAVEHGVFGGGLHYNEFAFSARDPRKLSKFKDILNNLGYLPSGELYNNILLDNRLLRRGKNVGMGIENFFRFGVFIDAVKNGDDFASAAAEVKKIFYDYRDLSTFERSWMRRIVPFYSWLRFNTPRMIETMFTRPEVHARLGQFVRRWEQQAVGGPMSEDELPDWVRDRFGIVVHKADDGTYTIRSMETLLPSFEVYAFFRNDGFAEFFQDKVVNQMTPIIKVPFENIFNKSLFTKQSLEQTPGEPARGFIASKLGFTRRSTYEGDLGILNWVMSEHFVQSSARILNEGFRFLDILFDDRETKNYPALHHGALLDLVLGRSYALDGAATQAWMYQDYKRNLNTLKRRALQAEAENNQILRDFYVGRMNKMRLEKPPGVDD